MGQQKPQLAIIRVISGPEAGQEFPVHGSAVTLGRTRDCEICIQDGMLSRRHCRLFLKNSEWLLEDLDSTNGTFVGGAQVRQPTPVNGTLRFRAGASLFEAEVSQRQSADTPTIAFRLDSRDPLMATQADSSGNDFPLANALELHEKMASLASEEDVLAALGQMIHEACPNAIVDIFTTTPDGGGSIRYAFGLNANGQRVNKSPADLPPGLLLQAQESREALLTDPVILPGGIVRRHLAAPMAVHHELLGIVCIAGATLGPVQLRAVSALCLIASPWVANHRLTVRNIANERLATLGNASASLSHYIKNILTGVDGCLYLMRMGIDDKDQELMNEAWTILSRNHKRLTALMLDLLNLAKEYDLQITRQPVGELLAEAASLVKPHLTSLAIELKIAPDLGHQPLSAELDPTALHRIMLNLLNNAADAVVSRHDGQTGGWVKVDAWLCDGGSSLCISCTDNGIGIKSEDLDQIFDMFFTGKGDAGTGLGLAVTRRLVEAHKGRIEVVSEPDRGTSFTLTFPVTQKGGDTRFYIDVADLEGTRS